MLLLLTAQLPVSGQNKSQQLVSSVKADTWVATDALGRRLATETHGGTIRKNKFVGIFYFVWHGAHGFDRHAVGHPDGRIVNKTPADTVSPYDISKLLALNPKQPKYGPVGAWHHWAEPYFGYYLPTDEWVIRKHAQLLADAGIDVIVFDVTNAYFYQSQVAKVAETFLKIRQEGNDTPGIAFMVNADPRKQVTRIYNHIYRPGLYRDLWFHWKGKPLLLTPPAGLTAETRDFFTTRHSWAWRNHWDNWFGDGQDKWPWVDHTPQAYGWHEDPQKPEQISVSIAQHPVYFNVGRSFHNGKQPLESRAGEGLYFAEQWQRAHEVDPEFVFVTGWNEWMTMRFKADMDPTFLGKPLLFTGKPVYKGDDYFVDLYNPEFSRDAEPVRGHFGDNYYYQLVDNIRRFKGARALPVYKSQGRIKIDGAFGDWQQVKAVYADDKGDITHRQHPGFGRIKEYVNTTGRNDITECRITSDKQQVYFYVKTARPLTRFDSPDWLRLYVGIPDAGRPGWEGFQYILNRKPGNQQRWVIERSLGGWQWEQLGEVTYQYKENELEVRVPKEMLGIKGRRFTLDFKWADNVPADGEPMHWLDKGDAAPNARFAYRYKQK